MKVTRKRHLSLALLVGVGVWAWSLICRRLLSVYPFVRPALTVAPEPTMSVRRYSDSYLGFAVEYPVEWEVTDYWEVQDPIGQPMTKIEFRSNLYPGGEQAFGKYGVNVAVGEAVGRTLTDTVEYRLSPIIPAVRDRIKRQCCLTVGGEAAMELTGVPWGRWDNRQVVVVHNGLEYRLTFYPYMQFNTPSGIAARAAFDTFLHTFTFIPITELPTPTISSTPVPTPTIESLQRTESAPWITQSWALSEAVYGRNVRI